MKYLEILASYLSLLVLGSIILGKIMDKKWQKAFGPKMKFKPVPSRWTLFESIKESTHVYVEARLQRDGSTKYVVTSGERSVLNSTELDFEYDSWEDRDSRINQTRFDSLEKAVACFNAAMNHPKNKNVMLFRIIAAASNS